MLHSLKRNIITRPSTGEIAVTYSSSMVIAQAVNLEPVRAFFMEKDKGIYDLGLHEEIRIDLETWVRRVPGGWIYIEYTETKTAVFVPYDNEFYTRLNDPFYLPL